ncbi:hypothetical protein NP233_g11398 [Leucocoprinus birnbaumii]|uniref:Uncharacterized protein n=1 Tax=Leucocoprinus birnbaumii TaxID=56174 RepID=A0AAD5YKG5_9AGAR|nr:hypothetical protein NP233_g11398 [Leucocoprinus birnbaumii]
MLQSEDPLSEDLAPRVLDLSTEELINFLRRGRYDIPIGAHLSALRPNTNAHSSSIIRPQDVNSEFWELWKSRKPSCEVINIYLEPSYPSNMRLVTFFLPRPSTRKAEKLNTHDPAIKTYVNISEKFLAWICNARPLENIFLCFYPSATPFYKKESVIEAALTICNEIGRLGAGIPIRGDWVRKVCSQLASRYPPYRRILAITLVEDPGIFHRCSDRALLKRLVLEPWDELRDSYPAYTAVPPVIFLDEVENVSLANHVADVLELVTDGRYKHQKPSLLWVIISASPPLDRRHPLVALTSAIQQSNLPYIYQHVAITPGGEEANRYSFLTLQARFRDVRSHHPHVFYQTETWPREEALWRIAKIVSGVDPFIDSLVRYIDIGGTDTGGPRERLDKCISCIANSPEPTQELPNNPLLHFYQQVLADTPSEILHCVEPLLECLYNRHLSRPTIVQLEHLLQIKQETIYRVLRHLAWMTDEVSHIRSQMPPLFRANPLYAYECKTYQLRIDVRHIFDLSHKLRRPLVSKTHVSAVKSYLDLLRKPIFTSLVPRVGVSVKDNPSLAIERLEARGLKSNGDLPWTMCTRAPRVEWETLGNLMQGFDFRHLVHLATGKLSSSALYRFLFWLKQINKDDIVRTEAVSYSDELLVAACGRVATPLVGKFRNLSSFVF